MRTRLLISASALFLGAGFAGPPALADVFVSADITKTETVTVIENINKTKDVDIFVTSIQTPAGAAEASAVANILNNNVHVDHAVSDDVITVTLPLTEFGIFRQALIDGSVNSNNGVVGVNQDVGNFANQSNIVSVALTNSTSSVTDSQASVDQKNTNSTATELEHSPMFVNGVLTFLGPGPNQSAEINNSVNSNNGVVGVNQNAGNINNQTNALALAVGPGSSVALAEADLGQQNTGDHVIDINTQRIDQILGSVTNNTGITTVNQSVGNFNNQSTTIAFSALTASAGVGNAIGAPHP